MSNGTSNSKKENVKLRELQIFSSEQLKVLQEYSILTAEQFVGICATNEGYTGVMGALCVTRESLDQMLIQVKNQLPTELSDLLSKGATISPPLGARKPVKKKMRKQR